MLNAYRLTEILSDPERGKRPPAADPPGGE